MESNLQKFAKPESVNNFYWTPGRENADANVPAPRQILTNPLEWDDDVIELMETEEIQNETSSEKEQGYELRKRLISFIRKKPILYDPKHTDFAVKRLKNIAWQSIAAQLNMSADTCQNMWAELRYKYQRYVRRLQLFLYNTDRAKTKATTIKRRILQRRRRPSMLYEVDMMFLYRFISPKFAVTNTMKSVPAAETNTAAISLANTSDDEDVVFLNYTEPNVIDLDGEEYRILPYKYTSQARTLAEAVSAYPELYNTEHRSFLSYRRRGIIWSAIAAELKDKGTKLMKFWMQLLVRYEWEICVGYAPEHNGGIMLKSSKLQEMLAYLEPFIRKNPHTVFKQSHYMKKEWYDPVDHFKTVVSLLDTLKQNPQLIKLTDDMLGQKSKPPAYDALWQKVSVAISCPPEQCEITWLLLRSFYWELVALRKEGYYLQDKWYFELVIGNLYKVVKASSSSSNSSQLATTTTAATPPITKQFKMPATTVPTTTTTTTTNTQMSATTKPLQNATTTQTTTLLNTTNESEIRMPKIVGAVSLAPIFKKMPPVCTPTHPTPPFLQMQPTVRPTLPPTGAPTRFPPMLQAKPPILAKPTIRTVSNATATMSGRTNRPINHTQYQITPAFNTLLFPSPGATTSQNFYLRPAVTQTQTTTAIATATATTSQIPSTSTIVNIDISNGKETNPLLFNLIRPQQQPPPTTTTTIAPIMSVRPQAQLTSVTEKLPQQQQQQHGSFNTVNKPIPLGKFSAILKPAVTVKATLKPTVVNATNTTTMSSTVETPSSSSIDLTGMLMPPRINISHKTTAISDITQTTATTSTTATTTTTTTEQTLEAQIPTTTAIATPNVLNTTPMLNPNQIMIELISNTNNKNKQLVIHGPALDTKYSLTMPVTVDFIREIMAMPILHNKQTSQTAKVNLCWQHISQKYNMPVHICKACWNFLAGNVAHFPQIAPMSEIMRPFKSKLKVWIKTQKLFRRFHSSALKKGWLKHINELPKLLKFLSPYTFLYEDVRRFNSHRQIIDRTTTEDKINVWKRARECFPNIAHPIEIWLAFKLVFVRYLMDLEDGYENTWPQNWWPSLAELTYLISARYDRLDPFYYIATNKFDEELLRCRALDLLRPENKNKATESKAAVPAATSNSASLNQLPLVIYRGVDAYELTRLVCITPSIYKKSAILVLSGAWLNVSKQLNISVRECIATLQYVLRHYLEYKARDPTNACCLNQKYYKHFDYIYSIVKTRIHDDRSKCTLIELLWKNEPPEVVRPRQYIPEINMSTSSVPLVMKNFANAASHLHDENLYIKMRSIFEKYRTKSLLNTNQ